MPSDDTTTTTTLQTDPAASASTTTADQLNDLIALATRKRWSHTVLLEHIVAAELEENSAAASRAASSAPDSDASSRSRDWQWPTALDDRLERILTLDFLARGDNVVLVGAHGLGKTMLAKNIAIRPSSPDTPHSSPPPPAARPQRTGTARALERRLRHYTRPTLLVWRRVGYLGYDARAADLIFQLVSRRYEHRSC